MEEVYRARYMGRGAELSCCLWVHRSPTTSMCSLPWALSEPRTSGIVWRLYHKALMAHSLHLQPISLLKKWGASLKIPSC